MREIERRQPTASTITHLHALVFPDRSPYIRVLVLDKLRSCLVRNHSVDCRRHLSVRSVTCSVLSFATLSFAALSGPVQAQTYDPQYPVCMTVYQGPRGGEWIDCSFTSMPQCHASASGRAAMCGVNPYFTAPPIMPPRAHLRRHRRAD